jgi:hypothetical protein
MIDDRFRKNPLPEDANMQQLWQSFVRYLLQKFPKAETLAKPRHNYRYTSAEIN